MGTPEALLDLPLDQIVVTPNRMRRYNKDDEKLQQTMDGVRRIGLINPIDVREREDGKYELVCGHKRFWIAKQLEWQTIKARLGTWTDAQINYVAMVENLHRDHLQ